MQPPLRFAALSPGLSHSCGIDVDGQAWCWGFGQGGQAIHQQQEGVRLVMAAPLDDDETGAGELGKPTAGGAFMAANGFGQGGGGDRTPAGGAVVSRQ